MHSIRLLFYRGRLLRVKKDSISTDPDSPAILRRRENYTWTPKGVSLSTVRSLTTSEYTCINAINLLFTNILCINYVLLYTGQSILC